MDRNVRSDRPPAWLGAALAIALLWCGGTARAQEAVWLATPRECAEPWYEAARSALEAEGVVVAEPDAASVGCTPALARAGARDRGVPHGLCVRVRGGKVVINLAGANGGSVQGQAEAGLELGRAVAEAYRNAEVALALGDDGLLRLHSTPHGALVTIDGEPAGHAPLERRLEPGSHTFELALEGFASARRTIEVERGRMHEVDVPLAKSASSEAASDAPTEASPLNYVLGAGLLLASAPALGFSIATLARDGECSTRDASGACSTQVHFGARSAVLLGAGIAAVLGGAAFLVLAPIEIEAAADANGAAVLVRSRF